MNKQTDYDKFWTPFKLRQTNALNVHGRDLVGEENTPMKTADDNSKTDANIAFFDNRLFEPMEGTKALSRNADAPKSLAAIQNFVALLGLFGVLNGGMPI
ncbi:MAG: hypothetical protein PHI31_08960 [Desulfuromonadaceae bacterium]|nr:hypothetical protein [Desulfuromonadaceae bacterium]